jgi:hypothetical protein
MLSVLMLVAVLPGLVLTRLAVLSLWFYLLHGLSGGEARGEKVIREW